MSLEYIAGFFDGEGSIGIYPNGRGAFHLRIQLVQNSKAQEVKDLFSELNNKFGGAVNEHTSSNGNKFYNWQLSSARASSFLKCIIPYLRIKREQALVATEWQDSRPAPTRNANGQYQANRHPNDAIVAGRLKQMKR